MTKPPANFLGIEIGGTKLQLVLQAGLHERNYHRLKVDTSLGAQGIRGQIETIVAKIVADVDIDAVGVGFGGPVDWRTGKICRSHQIEGWSEFDFRSWLQSLAGAPVFIDNDANVAALGEAVLGAGRGYNPVFYVTLGSGVGGGLVVDGNIYHGATPGESEVGHLRLDREGTIVESRCSGWAVDAKVRAIKNSHPESMLAKNNFAKPGGEASFLAEALAQKDAIALQILAETADDLAFGLSHVVQLFHPEIIVIGGGLSKLGAPLLDGVKASLQKYIMEAFAPGPEVCLSVLKEDAVPLGALELARLAHV